MPVIADAELVRKMVEHGQIGCVVVAHHDARIALLDPATGERLRVARRETVHRAPVDLSVGRRRSVLWVPEFVREVRSCEMMDRVATSVVIVGHPGCQTVDVVPAALERQVPEHVIKRAVLQHEHDDVLDPPKTAVLGDSHGPPVLPITRRR